MNWKSLSPTVLIPLAVMSPALFAPGSNAGGSKGPGPSGGCITQTQQVDAVIKGDTAGICPCFLPDEIVMTIHDNPATTPPPGLGGSSKLKSVQIMWQNFLGSAATTTEDAVIIYAMNQTGPVNPATFTEIVTIPNPQLSAGFLNQFDFNPPLTLPTNRFGVGLRFRNATTGTIFIQLTASTIVHDTNGHNNGPSTIRNWIFTDAGQWITAQGAGVSGDWVIRAVVENCPPPPGGPDLNHDGFVDGLDLAMLLAAWGPCPVPPTACPADFDGRGGVNGIDLATLLAAWDPA